MFRAASEGRPRTEATYKARGCPASIAAGSALTVLMVGRARDEWEIVRQQDVEKAVGGIGARVKHAAQLCVDAD